MEQFKETQFTVVPQVATEERALELAWEQIDKLVREDNISVGCEPVLKRQYQFGEQTAYVFHIAGNKKVVMLPEGLH